MLRSLHVKNLALIRETEVEFGEGLNILTGETGAGKSILVGSIGIALGARVSPEIIGKRADYAMVELVFQIEKPETIEALREMDIEPEAGQIVISRKITTNRSINKINGESPMLRISWNQWAKFMSVPVIRTRDAPVRFRRHFVISGMLPT